MALKGMHIVKSGGKYGLSHASAAAAKQRKVHAGHGTQKGHALAHTTNVPQPTNC